MESRIKILDKLNVKELSLGGEMKSLILTFMNKDAWNFCQMNLLSADLAFITFVWVLMILCTGVPTESIPYAVVFFLPLTSAMLFYMCFH